jgi:hypothetical protein
MNSPLGAWFPIPWLVLAIFVFCGLIALFIAWLFLDWVLQKNAKAREVRSMRIRDEQLRRYNITAFRGTKDRFL